MFREFSEEKLRFVFLTAVNDYLKVNNYRIASFSGQRTETPLASRNDIKPFVETVKNDSNLDIVGLSPENKVFLARAINMPLDQLIAHPANDPSLLNSIKSLVNTFPQGSAAVSFLFITTGIILPDLVQLKDLYQNLKITQEELSNYISDYTFLEMRIDPKQLAKFDDQKIYLRNIITRSRWLGNEYKEFPDFKCDICSNNVYQGEYRFRYWEKELKVPYWICKNDGAQFEAGDTGDKASVFISSFR